MCLCHKTACETDSESLRLRVTERQKKQVQQHRSKTTTKWISLCTARVHKLPQHITVYTHTMSRIYRLCTCSYTCILPQMQKVKPARKSSVCLSHKVSAYLNTQCLLHCICAQHCAVVRDRHRTTVPVIDMCVGCVCMCVTAC